ncbi:MAG TPA: DUF2807 domain-containing protein [Candidatus Cloacimonadota bacterium]|nr:DUF2807 domain-containing protein [Candidatus Cloacimonadota bacterium]HQB40535.1 DUF2807 domain-containing protein [Candidatus Cloacimonadota bacterium]
MDKVFLIMIVVLLLLLPILKTEAKENNSNSNTSITELDLKSVNSVETSVSCKIVLKQGKTQIVSIKGQGIEKLNIYVKGKTLYIKKHNESFSLNRFFRSKTEHFLITICLNEINSISVKGSAAIMNSTPIEGNNLNIRLNGVGAIELTELNYNNIDAYLKGTGAIELGGTTNTLNLSLKGVGSIKTENLKAYSCKAFNYGIGAISLYAENELEATLSGVGSIEYYGNPKVIKHINGIGVIEKAN